MRGNNTYKKLEEPCTYACTLVEQKTELVCVSDMPQNTYIWSHWDSCTIVVLYISYKILTYQYFVDTKKANVLDQLNFVHCSVTLLRKLGSQQTKTYITSCTRAITRPILYALWYLPLLQMLRSTRTVGLWLDASPSSITTYQVKFKWLLYSQKSL